MRTIITTDRAPRPVGPYSQAIALGDLVFISGQIGIDPRNGKLVEGGAREEAARCMENLKGILTASGLELRDVAKTTIYVTDISTFREVNEAYAAFFPFEPPARSTVGVATLPLGAKVEIEAIACRPRPSP
jgi:2-iminobutanoate/2-iminopropanoate deaminase